MTNLSVRSESLYGGSDDRWLGSREGLSTATTATLDADAFGAGTFPGGVVKSGTPLAKSGNLYVPFTDDATQDLAGFLATDQNVTNGDAIAPMIDRGRIRTAFLPVAFTVPAGSSRFVFES
jgi:hypothetical protein